MLWEILHIYNVERYNLFIFLESTIYIAQSLQPHPSVSFTDEKSIVMCWAGHSRQIEFVVCVFYSDLKLCCTHVSVNE